MAGSGPGRPTRTPPRHCARLYYCLTRASIKCSVPPGRAPLLSTGNRLPTDMSTFSKARIGKIPVDRISLDDMLSDVTDALRSHHSKPIFYANSYAVTLAEDE